MIQPIFFPFTHLQRSDIETISSLFKSILFFPALTVKEYEESENHMKDQDFCLPIFADSNDFEQVVQKVDEYKNWGELNKDNRCNLKSFLQDKPYLTDVNGISSIRAGIDRVSKRGQNPQPKEDPLLKNLMFLRLSKIHDLEKEKLNIRLAEIEKEEQRLFSSLRGFGNELDENLSSAEALMGNQPVQSGKNDLGEYMSYQRIVAWVDFFNKKKRFDSFNSSLLFVTTSSAVFEYLLSVAKNKIKMLDSDNLKVHERNCENKSKWVEAFNECVEHLVMKGELPLNQLAEIDDNCTFIVKIKLYFLEGDVISSFFQGIEQKIPVCFLSV